MPTGIKCRLCNSESCRVLFDFGQQPNVLDLLKNKDDPYAAHPLILHQCNDCNFVFINDPMALDYKNPEVQKSTASYPPAHLPLLVSAIKANLAGKINPFIYEVGCNDGLFLEMLKENGFANIMGIDPSSSCVDIARNKGLKVATGYFSEETAIETLNDCGAPALVICRQVLEHITDLDSFMNGLQAFTDAGSLLLIESPDLELSSFSEIWEQHVNYFDTSTLQYLLLKHHMEIVGQSDMAHEYYSFLVWVEKSKDMMNSPVIERSSCRQRISDDLAMFSGFIEKIRQEGRTMALFGAGARGTMLINLAGAGDIIAYVVDDNEHKVGRFLPGCGIPVIPFDEFKEKYIDILLIAPLSSEKTRQKVINKIKSATRKEMTIISYVLDNGRVRLVYDNADCSAN